MNTSTASFDTQGEGFYSITDKITSGNYWQEGHNGILVLYCQHTSCAMTITESYDPLAVKDIENFLTHLAPRNLQFIQHDDEGPDDSPSHMKSALLQTSLTIPIENGKLMLGTWQGIFLCEFRDAPKVRKLVVKVL